MQAVSTTAVPGSAGLLSGIGRSRHADRPDGLGRPQRDTAFSGSTTDAHDPRREDAVIPIAVAYPIAALITGGLRPATVLSAHSAALVLRVEPFDPSHSVTRVVTLLTREGSGVPNGARTALSAADRPFAAFAVGDAAFVGGGGVRLPSRTFHAVRTIRTAVPHLTPAPELVRLIAEVAQAAPRGVADDPVLALRAALDSGDAGALRSAVRALVGLGTGSTPGGDDVLAGTLAGLRARRCGVRAEQVAAAALPGIESRTPLMSADLLRLAAAGHVCAEAAAVLRASTGTRVALMDALAGLLAIGHTSGADLATGLAIGLGAAGAPEPRRARRSRMAPRDHAPEPLAIH